MEKPQRKFALIDPLRNAGFQSGRGATPLSLMLLWSQLPATKLNGLPSLGDASAEFILKASEKVGASLCPELAAQTSSQWAGLRPNDVELMRRGIMNALDSGLTSDDIAETILEYCAPAEWAAPEPTSALLAVLDAKKGAKIRCAFSYACHPAWSLSKLSDVDLDVENSDMAIVLTVLAKACGRSLSVRVNAIGAIVVSQSAPDHALILPPLGMRLKLDRATAPYFDGPVDGPVSAEILGTLWGAHLGRKRNVIVVGNGLLFRTSSNDAAFKRELIQKHGLEAVISLPRGLFPKTSIAVSALVFSGGSGLKGPPEALRFINASEPGAIDPATLSKLIAGKATHPLCVDCPTFQVTENGFNLSVDRYVLDKAAERNRELLDSQETVALADIADIRRPQAFPRELGTGKGIEVREAMLADIDHGRLSLPEKLSELPQSAATKIDAAILKPGDILLSIKGTIGKAALVTSEVIAESASASIVPGQSLVVIRLRKGGLMHDPEVLFSYLRSPLAQSLLQGMAGGTTIANVAMGTLKTMQVPVLPMKAQKRVLEKYREYQDLQRNVDSLREKMKTTETQLFSLTLGQQ